MATKGRMSYIPPIIIDEMEDIRRENGIGKQAEALKEMVRYARVGREMERIIKLDWNKAKARKRIEDFFR